MLRALYEVVSKAGANMSETSKQVILGLIDDESGERDGETTWLRSRRRRILEG